MNDELGDKTATRSATGTPTAATPSDRDCRVTAGDLRPGDLIAEKYRFDCTLGSGGMGLVLRATHVDLNRPVAIKVVRREFLGDEEIVARMLAEAQMAASLRSEHVARVLDLGRLDSGAPYIVFEYLEGRDLAALLDERGALAPELAVEFLLHACDALAEAHRAGIVHRDLKPDNLFLTERPDGAPILKVLDFGVSKKLSARDRRAVLTNPLQLIGSPYYMAPEQMRTGSIADARADVWALGVVLYELCTGRTPFSADSVPGVCAMVLDEDPPAPSRFAPQLPRGLERIILRCLRKHPERRYQNVTELASALVHFGPAHARPYAERISRVFSSASSAEIAVPLASHGKNSGSGSTRHCVTQRSGGIQGPLTPLSLAATVRGPSSERAAAGKPSRKPVLVFAAAVSSSLLASTLFFEQRARAVRPTARAQVTAPARSAFIPPTLVAASLVPEPETPSSVAKVPPPPAALEEVRAAAPKNQRNRATKPVPAKSVEPPPAREPTAPESRRPDPWDPKNFGGRL